MTSEIAKNFILITTYIELDKSGISYAAYSRITNMVNNYVRRGVAMDLFTSAISISIGT